MHRSVVIGGSLAQSARQGGLTWWFLQLLLGLRKLGWKVLFLDRLEPEMCVDEHGHSAPLERSFNVPYLLEVMRPFDLEKQLSLSVNGGRRTIGVGRAEVWSMVSGSACLLNIMGFVNDEAILELARRRVFVDIDPGFPQMWKEVELHDAFAGHTDFVTLGRNIGRPDCTIPTCGLKWITMPQPVVLDHWPAQPPKPKGAFTSIGAWRGPNAPIEYRGHTYGLRAHEFRKFVELPGKIHQNTAASKQMVPTRFELALDIHPADRKDIELLKSNGWAIVDPKQVACGPEEYRAYIAASKAEFMVPKQMYVDTKSGLLSDRSVYYLASGRPVLARDTGIKHLYPTGEGLLTFSTLDEAAAGVEEINGNYARHCKAAREIAEEYFDSDKVLRKLLEDLGL